VVIVVSAPPPAFGAVLRVEVVITSGRCQRAGVVIVLALSAALVAVRCAETMTMCGRAEAVIMCLGW
jgi:hypothetical protein